MQKKGKQLLLTLFKTVFSYVAQEMELVNSARGRNKVNKISCFFEIVHILIVPFKIFNDFLMTN